MKTATKTAVKRGAGAREKRAAAKRPVAAVADQKEVRDVAQVTISAARDHTLTLLFDRGAGLEERIFAEQFQV